MTTYHKIVGLAFSIIIITIVGLLIYGVKSSDISTNVLETIEQLDTNAVNEIIIEPKNIEWKTSLTLDTVIIKDSKKINNILSYLKIIQVEYPGKTYKTIWDSRLTLIFKSPNKINLKNKERMTLDLLKTPKGLFFELPNTTEYQPYKCERLDKYLESIVNFKKPIEGNNK